MDSFLFLVLFLFFTGWFYSKANFPGEWRSVWTKTSTQNRSQRDKTTEMGADSDYKHEGLKYNISTRHQLDPFTWSTMRVYMWNFHCAKCAFALRYMNSTYVPWSGTCLVFERSWSLETRTSQAFLLQTVLTSCYPLLEIFGSCEFLLQLRSLFFCLFDITVFQIVRGLREQYIFISYAHAERHGDDCVVYLESLLMLEKDAIVYIIRINIILACSHGYFVLFHTFFLFERDFLNV